MKKLALIIALFGLSQAAQAKDKEDPKIKKPAGQSRGMKRKHDEDSKDKCKKHHKPACKKCKDKKDSKNSACKKDSKKCKDKKDKKACKSKDKKCKSKKGRSRNHGLKQVEAEGEKRHKHGNKKDCSVQCKSYRR